ncbi:hypothetical protein Fmac_022922 [Flemingia macrophylla]|uniref:Uncharacterized protein n=1 Tax=Flemingia macrophylla TaxID=520843 RepID=A0ABD1LK09_9FABA
MKPDPRSFNLSLLYSEGTKFSILQLIVLAIKLEPSQYGNKTTIGKDIAKDLGDCIQIWHFSLLFNTHFLQTQTLAIIAISVTLSLPLKLQGLSDSAGTAHGNFMKFSFLHLMRSVPVVTRTGVAGFLENQNLPTVSQSLLQQTGSEADVKPFSIRQYALASRHRSTLHSWPFHEKHLQLCLKHGLKEVLPPFVTKNSLAEPLKGCSNLTYSRNDDSQEVDSCKAEVPDFIDDHLQCIKNECDCKVANPFSSHEEGNQHKGIISANLSQPAEACTFQSSTNVYKSLPPSKAVKDKRRRRRGRCKKRSMVDILAVARHSTLEEIHRINQFCQQMVPYENISKSEVVSEDSCCKAESEDHAVANVDMAAKGPLLLKFKLNGYSACLVPYP